MNRFALRLIVSVFFIFSVSQVSAATAKKPWTVLVFLNADNNLEDFGYEDIQEMEKVGSNDQVNVVVQFDPEYPKGTDRIYIEKATQSYSSDRSFQSKVLEKMPEQDMGDTETFIDFVSWGMQNYPAEKYVVILWNHGSGWDKNKNTDSVFKGISYDDTSGNHITTNQLADAVDSIVAATGNRIDILGFDACLMGMFEIADSLVGMVDYLVASEETEPGDGYPYDDFLRAFETHKNISATELSKHMVRTYGKSYEAGGSQNSSNPSSDYDYDFDFGDGDGRWGGTPSVTQSAIDLSKLELVKRRLDRWITSVKNEAKITKTDLGAAADQTVYYADSSYKDLGNYVQNVLNRVAVKDGGVENQKLSFSNSGLIGSSLSLLRAIQDAVIENYASPRFQASTGISIWLPYSRWGSSGWQKNGYKRNSYEALKWTQTTAWANHLDYLIPSDEGDSEEHSN